MAQFQLPLINIPQSFQISLAGQDYILTCKYNDTFESGWIFDLQSALTNEYIVANVPLVTGCDLLQGLEYLGIGGQLIVYTDGNEFAVPTIDNLGVESNVYFVTEG